MEREHSLLSPSSAEIWLVCNPSARFAARFEKAKSDYADEGTLCHSIATDQLLFKLKRLSRADYLAKLGEHKRKRLYDPEMDGYATQFVDYVLNIYNSYKLNGWADIWVEERIDYDHIVPDGYGHLDVAIISAKTIDIIDFKYGKNIAKSAIANPQLGLYALGVLKTVSLYADLFDDYERINLHIHQPRIDNISTYSDTVAEYNRWGDTTVKKAAQLAWKGKGEFKAGIHCKFCAAKAKCKEYTNRHTALEQFEQKPPYEMTNEEIAGALSIIETLNDWATAIKEFATQEARKGAQFSGFKLVNGRSARVFIEGKENEVIALLAGKGYYQNQYMKRGLKGITEMEKLLGKEGLKKTLGQYIVKPTPSPILVPETDTRAAISGNAGAKNAFKNVIKK